MKRFHVHVAVADLEQSTAFYARLFGAQPTVQEPGYARWLMDDPRVNFAISTAGSRAGIEHLGLQADSDTELREVRARMVDAGSAIKDEQAAACCYAISDKHWTVDPQGVVWEAFHTLAAAGNFGNDRGLSVANAPQPEAAAAACCAGTATRCC
jgi:lactoylglutathione lyase